MCRQTEKRRESTGTSVLIAIQRVIATNLVRFVFLQLHTIL